MNLSSRSELMKGQRHATIMSPDKAFQTLVTETGSSVFFSIGTDNAFYVTRETGITTTGWSRIDLSSALPGITTGTTVTAKTFAVAQQQSLSTFRIVLVVTIAGSDALFATEGDLARIDNWVGNFTWTQIPFDAAGITPPSPLVVADLAVMDLSHGTQAPTCFIDILRDASDPLQLLDRYYINLDAAVKWARHTLAIDLKSGSISNFLGRRTNDLVPGLYTFGKIQDTVELIFTPQMNPFKPSAPPNVSRLTLPNGSTAIASVANQDGTTLLLVASEDGIYLFTPDNQHDGAIGTLIISAFTLAGQDIIGGITSMFASQMYGKTVVCALNSQASLVRASCAIGSEASPSSWSTPIPFCFGVEQFTFALDNSNGNVTLFAQTSGQTLIQLVESQVDEWVQRNIILPSTDVNDMVEFDSFTTHLSLTDENGSGAINTQVSLTSDSPIPVYVNNSYQVLTPSVPVIATTDETGAIVIIQETSSLFSPTIQASTTGKNPVTTTVVAHQNVTNTLSTIQSGNDLSKVQITTASGTTKNLIPAGVASGDTDTAAKTIVQLMAVHASLTTDTGPATSAEVSSHQATAANPRSSISDGASKVNDLQVIAKDLFRWLENAIEDVEHFVVTQVDNVWQLIVKIGDAIITAILDTVSAVVNAVVTVFNKIKVLFEDLVAWLGYLFGWDDIIRTHKVIKFHIKAQAAAAVNALDTLEGEITDFFQSLENRINAWGDITDPASQKTLGGQQNQARSQAVGSDTPQSSWAMNHTRNGIGSAETSAQMNEASGAFADDVTKDLVNLLEEEEDAVETAVKQIKDQVLGQIFNLSPVQIVKKIMAIVADVLVKTAENILTTLVDVVKAVLSNIITLLDAPLSIPILSPLYKLITGEDLSILDLVCLVAAVPTTIIYKIAFKAAPFPDDTSANAAMVVPQTPPSLVQPQQSRLTQTSRVQFAAKSLALNLEAVPPNTPATRELDQKALDGDGATEIRPVAPKAGDVTEDGPTTPTAVIVVLYIAALPASGLVALMSVAKQALPDGTKPPRAIGATAFCSHLVYVAPNFTTWKGTPWVGANLGFTFISILKAGLDNFYGLKARLSNRLEFIINAGWLAPAFDGIIETDPRKASDWSMFFGNVCFDASGVLAPWSPGNEDIFAAMQVLTIGYGVFCLTAGIAVGSGA